MSKKNQKNDLVIVVIPATVVLKLIGWGLVVTLLLR